MLLGLGVIAAVLQVARPVLAALFSSLAAVLPVEAVQLGLVVLAGVLGLVLLRTPGRRSAGLFAVAFVLWAAPRAANVALWVTAGRPPSLPSVTGAFDPVTFDTALTLVVLCLAVAWWRGRRHPLEPRILLLLLVVSTAVVFADIVLYTPLRSALFAVGLAAPVAYQFLFDAAPLNQPGASRPTRVLATTGLACSALTLAMVEFHLGRLTPQSNLDPALGAVLFAVPFAVLTVLATVTEPEGAA